MNGQRNALARRSGALRLGLVAVTVAQSACGAPADTQPAAGAPVEARQDALMTLARTGWVASASSTSGSNVAANALDGSATTRWSTSGAQTGQFFQVDMLSPQIFSEVTLDAGTTSSNFPRAYQLNVSNDGTTWTSVTTGTGSTALVTITFATQTARFIRINQTATVGTMWSIQELNVFGLAHTRTGWVATASSTSGTNVAANALDGSLTTRWSSSGAQTGQSFQVDMQSPQTFNRLTLDAGTTTNNFPRGYQVFVSNDGTNWGTAIATGTGTTAFISITFPTQWARFVKITQTATNSTTWSIQELNIAGEPTIPTAQPRAGWVATASSTSGTNVAANALDGSTTTRWSTSGAQTGQSFQVDMLVRRTFNQIVLDAGTTTNNFPRAYQVQTSNNGTTFTTVTSGTGSAALVTINFPAQTARFIKINQTATNSTTWSIQEMTVSGQALSPRGWLPTATSTGGTDVPANALDGVATTRWSTAVAQANGQTFQVDMVTAQVFNQLTLDAGTSTGNFPRGYAVSASNDGTNWGTPVATGTGSSQLVTINFVTQTARFFKIVQTGTATNVWSIHELNVWRTVQPCDTVTCVASDLCHAVGVCDPNTGVCSNPVVANPTTVACNDGNGCTTTDRCTATGSCAGVAVVCTAQDACHVAGTCTNGVCSNPVVANPTTVACNDGNACTTTDRCTTGGTCAGVALVCTAQDVCHVAGTCTNGVCSNPVVANPTTVACNDGNACTTTDRCTTGGTCAGVAVVCTAQDVCHVAGTCTNGVCSNPVVANPTTVACNDGNACTTTDRCTTGGTCAGVAVTCTTDQCHTIGACVPATGCPAAAPKINGTTCNDSNACTTGETCQLGVCSSGHAQTCSGSGNTSTVAVGSGGGSVTLEGVTVQFPPSVFTSATNVTITSTTNAPPAGMTAYTPIYRFDPDGAQFSTPATVTFVVGTALTNPVIVWSHPGGGWDEIGGTYANGQISAPVTHFSQGFVALGQCVGQNDGATCTDGNACTVGDSCLTGLCRPGTTALAVDDSNGCTTDSCNPSTGAVHTNVDDGTTCNDHKVCTLNDTCHAGICTGSPSPACVPPPALTLTEIAAAKQAGLLPSTYLTPTLFAPMGTAPYDPTSSQSGTEAWAINDAGTTVGYSQGAENEGIGGQMVYAFVADSAGERLLTPYWPTGPTYPTAINQAGWIAGFGGPVAQTTTAQDWSRIVIYPPGPSPQPQAPPLPVPVWLGSPIRFWTRAIDNVIGSAGLPTIYGSATYMFGGTKDVWHLDNDVVASVGPHSLSGLPASPEWTTGHAGLALHMNGSVCLSTPVATGTLPYLTPGLTMMAWVNPDAAMCPGGRRTIVARTTDFDMSLACKGDNSAAALTGHIWLGTFWAPVPAGTVPFGQWSHVAISFDYHAMRTFVNGALAGELTTTSTAVGSYQQTVSVGCSAGAPATDFVGALDEVSTFDVPMGADQINLYMNGTTNYRASAQYHDLARYKDGFFDVVLAPSDPIYTGSLQPFGANDLGMATAAAYLTGGGTSAVVYDPQKGWIDLNSLISPDSNWNLQVATAVDENGRYVVGYGRYYGLSAAWRFDAVTGEIINLGNLPFPYTYPDFQLPIIPRSINSKGHVAGAMMDQSNFWSQQAFIYTDETGMFPLNDLIDPAQPVTLRDAKQINDNDEVVGISWHSDNTIRRGYKLSLPPLPSVDVASCAGKANGASCDDGDRCTQTDTCQAGKCVGSNPVVCAAPQSCHSAACNPSSGVCDQVAVADGTACSDGDACTQIDTCQAGTCVGAIPVTCRAFDQCHLAGVCDTLTGQCSNPMSSDPGCVGYTTPVVTPQTPSTPGLAPPEIVGIDPGTGTINVSPAQGSAGGSPPPATQVTVPALQGTQATCVADFNGDGAADLALIDTAAGKLSFLWRTDAEVPVYDPTRIFVADTALPTGTAGQPACGDIDGDGIPDLVVPVTVGAVPTLLYYSSQHLLLQRITIPSGFPTGVLVTATSLADLDGDGRLDLTVYAASNQAAPLLNSQIFVFPNSGIVEQPFSSASRVSVPLTEPLVTTNAPNWGALTNIDWDGDGRPDIWAVGNRGVVLLYRTLPGFQFAQPEFDGVIPNLAGRFTIAHLEMTGDGIPDLVLGQIGLAPLPPPIVFPGAGGGLIRDPLPPLNRPGTVAFWGPKPFFLPGRVNPPDMGLIKGSPVVTTYLDKDGTPQPSIFVLTVDGHLAERAKGVSVTTNFLSQVLPQRGGLLPPRSFVGCLSAFCEDPTGFTPLGTRVSTPVATWSWYDHGTPPGTLVADGPAVAMVTMGVDVTRQIFVRGLDGHLWELTQTKGTETWNDRGLPPLLDNTQICAQGPCGPGPSAPLVAAPTVINDMSLGILGPSVFVVDAAGRLDNYQSTADGDPWRTLGPVGQGSCFGDIGHVGSGSPAALTWMGMDFVRRQQVLVTSALGDLFSWRDGSWEESLSQYTVDLSTTGVTPPNRDHPMGPSTIPVCPNGPNPVTYSSTTRGPTTNYYQPKYRPTIRALGTPSALAWSTSYKFFGATTTFDSRSAFVRASDGSLMEVGVFGESPVVPASFNPVTLNLVADQLGGVGHLSSSQNFGVTFHRSQFCKATDGETGKDLFVSDPVVVQDSSTGWQHVLVRDADDDVNILHRRPTGPVLADNWEEQPLETPAFRASGFQAPAFFRTLGTAGATASGAVLEIYANRSNGTLIQATSVPDANGGWNGCDTTNLCPPGCVAHGQFTDWDTTRHLPNNIDQHKILLTNSALELNDVLDSENTQGAAYSRCNPATVVNTIFPQWASIQRWNPSYFDFLYHPPSFDTGYDADMIAEVEGVVVASHIAALDNPIAHTLGQPGELPRQHHDWNIDIAPDVKYQNMITEGTLLTGGTMELEWEMGDHLFGNQLVVGTDEFTSDMIPAVGDRVAVRGRYIFDCGHPPYHTEIHPINAMAVIHGSELKVHTSAHGGMTWYQPGDVNLHDGEASNITSSLTKIEDKISDEGFSGLAHLAMFALGCKRTFDQTLIAPPISGYVEYAHGNRAAGNLSDIISDDFSPTAAVPLTLLHNIPLTFTLPASAGPVAFNFNGTMIAAGPPDANGSRSVQIPPEAMPFEPQPTTSVTLGSPQTPRWFRVCFDRRGLRGHDDFGSLFFTIVTFDYCDHDTDEELVTYVSANNQTRLYAPGGDNCLDVPLTDDQTLTVSSHGFECDLSCGERPDDDFASAPDDKIGSIQAAFSSWQNFGAPPISALPPFGATPQIGQAAYYRLTSQPDLTTDRSRDLTRGDYQMTIGINQELPP